MQTAAQLTTLRWVALAMLMSVAVARPAFAGSARASDGASRQAQSSLDFRIVIPETVRMDRRDERIGRVQTFTSRATEVRAGAVVVTIAKP